MFKSLAGAEVVLTFGIDALLNFLNESKIGQTAYHELGIIEIFIKQWRKRNGSGMNRPLAQ